MNEKLVISGFLPPQVPTDGEFVVNQSVGVRRGFDVFSDINGVSSPGVTGVIMSVPEIGERYYHIEPDQPIYCADGR